MSRHDRYGERTDDEPTLWDAGRPSPGGAAKQFLLPPAVQPVCELCTNPLQPGNASGICAECRLVVHNLFGKPFTECWRDHPDGEHVVSDRGRIARLLPVDHSHRYPRVSIAGQKVYLHAMVAGAWHGPRPDGALVLHYDDDPDNPTAENLRYGDHAENFADRQRNHRKETG